MLRNIRNIRNLFSFRGVINSDTPKRASVSPSPCKGYRVSRVPLLQQSPVIIIFQYLHLLNGNTVEFYEPLPLWHSVIDEYSIDILHI